MTNDYIPEFTTHESEPSKPDLSKMSKEELVDKIGCCLIQIGLIKDIQYQPDELKAELLSRLTPATPSVAGAIAKCIDYYSTGCQIEQNVTIAARSELATLTRELADYNDRVIPNYVAVVKRFMCVCGHSYYDHMTIGEECIAHDCPCDGFTDPATALTARITELDKSESQLITDRDELEDYLSKMFVAVFDRSPEWSNMYGYNDAVLEVEERIAELEADSKRLEWLCLHIDTMTEIHYANNDGKPLGYNSGMTKEERVNKERDHTMCDFVTDALGIKPEIMEADLSKLTTKDLEQCQYDIPCPNLECENPQCMCDRMGEWMTRHATLRSLVERLVEGLESHMGTDCREARRDDLCGSCQDCALITEGREALK